jgi:hypothetical protein
MHYEHAMVAGELSRSIEDLYEKFGLWKLVRALAHAVWRSRRRRNHVADLSRRMRLDIGLPDEEDLLHRPKFSIWDIRL